MLRHGVRRFVAALSGEIDFAALVKSDRALFYYGYCGPMNWPVQGGDESPHSMSIRKVLLYFHQTHHAPRWHFQSAWRRTQSRFLETTFFGCRDLLPITGG